MEQQSQQRTRPINILLIEDNDADIQITLRAFKEGKLANNVFVVRDGQEGLDYINHMDKETHPLPDLILLDINMPRMDGFEFLTAIKADGRYRAIPVVMLTSSDNDDDVAKCYGSGAASYIKKPVQYDKFVDIIEGFNFYWHIINKLPGGKPT